MFKYWNTSGYIVEQNALKISKYSITVPVPIIFQVVFNETTLLIPTHFNYRELDSRPPKD